MSNVLISSTQDVLLVAKVVVARYDGLFFTAASMVGDSSCQKNMSSSHDTI